MLSYSVFGYPENQSTTGVINTSACASSTSTTSMVKASITVDLTGVGYTDTTEASVIPVLTSAHDHEGNLI